MLIPNDVKIPMESNEFLHWQASQIFDKFYNATGYVQTLTY